MMGFGLRASELIYLTEDGTMPKHDWKNQTNKKLRVKTQYMKIEIYQ